MCIATLLSTLVNAFEHRRFRSFRKETTEAIDFRRIGLASEDRLALVWNRRDGHLSAPFSQFAKFFQYVRTVAPGTSLVVASRRSVAYTVQELGLDDLAISECTSNRTGPVSHEYSIAFALERSIRRYPIRGHESCIPFGSQHLVCVF